MKSISGALKSAIADDGTVATCIRITRTDGVIVGFTNHDIALTVSGVKYNPLPALERIVMKLRNNAEVSNQDFVAGFMVSIDEQDITNGLYNEASFDVIYVDWKDPSLGGVTVFSGVLGNIQWNRDGFACDIYNLVYKLETPIGTIFSGKCRHQLFSQPGDEPWMVGACGKSSAGFTHSGTVDSVSTQKLVFVFTGFAPATNYLSNGVLTWTFGDNIGKKIEVKSNTSNTISLFLPTDFTISPGDTFTVTAGCDKTLDTCRDKFNNVISFGGFPFKGEQ